eukprot:TRINITY_DN1467_c0_g5_i1.p1 TRINITY_DN1467_c0_g5~~TRINITY_DN1467_c0_g5_i1.p1  ORF type:complete len:107 (+),score=5.61 TRINITY_DN1467_c0_g5_i1:381-701(+)
MYYQIVAFTLDMNTGAKYFIGTLFLIIEDTFASTVITHNNQPSERLDMSLLFHSTYSTLSIIDNTICYSLIINPPVFITDLQQIKQYYQLQPHTNQSNSNHHVYFG